MTITNPNWTLEEACAANDQALADDPTLSFADPALPLFQWSGLKNLEQQQKIFNQGEKFALMQALCICATHDIPLPDWVSRAYLAAYHAVVNVRIERNSWDTVLGTPYPKNSTLSALRKRRYLMPRVYIDVNNVLKTEPDTPIDAVLFERIGEKLGLGKTLTEEYYYASLQMFGRSAKTKTKKLCVQRLPLKRRK